MGLLDFFRREKAFTASPEVVDAAAGGQLNTYHRLGGTNLNTQRVREAWLQVQSASYSYMYERQPAVRRVVDYISRNVRQLELSLYERVSETDRRLDPDHTAARTMAQPNDLGPADAWIYDFVADFLVNENAYAVKLTGPRRTLLIRIPPPAMGVHTSGRFTIDGYRIHRSDGTYFDLPPEDVLHWRGYAPENAHLGLSRLETLRQILAEDAASQSANVELLKSGLQKPGVIERPIEAPEWSEDARKRFQESFANQVKSSSRRTPVLEEGMKFADLGVSPKDAEMLEGRRFTNEEVASLYGLKHIPPEGEDERRQFLADVLAPLCEEFASVLDFGLLGPESDFYFEFDLNEKLRGDPERRFSAMTSAAGRPWLTVNEVRAFEGKPAVSGGDELTIPLNVALAGEGGRTPQLPAPNVMPPQDPNDVPQDGSHREASLPQGKALLIERRATQLRRRDVYADELKSVLERHYDRQEAAIRSSQGGKAIKASRWEKWNSELADDLDPVLLRAVEREGDVAAQRLGALGFDSRLVRNYLRAMSEDVAKNLNAKTREELAGAPAEDVFSRAKAERAPVAAMGLATSAAAFAVKEAANQAPGSENRVKTWVVTSDDSEHPEMDGETVPLGATFSNGAEGPPADHPGCQCLMEVT
jgi:HK97 family phage portal protein